MSGRTAVESGFARARAHLAAARRVAPRMTRRALWDALRRAEAFLFTERPVSKVPDFALAAAAVAELARRVGS